MNTNQTPTPITRRTLIKSLSALAASAVLPSTVKAIDFSPMPSIPDLFAKVDRAIRHLEDLCGKRYDPSTDELHLTCFVRKWLPKDIVEDIQRAYPNVHLNEAKTFTKKIAIRVTMFQPTDVGYWVTYSFDTHTWHDSTGIPFALV